MRMRLRSTDLGSVPDWSGVGTDASRRVMWGGRIVAAGQDLVASMLITNWDMWFQAPSSHPY